MRKMKYRVISILGALLLFVTCFSGFNRVKTYAKDGTLPSGIGYNELDGRIRDYIKEHEATAAGLAWSVFDADGDISSGYYGYADKENGIAVDDDTVFEWGSGTKILVWISVMQMYERGAIDLDADISTYLPDKFLSFLKYDDKITMINLMNHTAGFQNVTANVNIMEPDYYKNLEEAVTATKPVQIYKPGTVNAYSNWGTSLAAYIVERTSGMEFYEYVRKNILEPLGLSHTALYMDLSDNEWVLNQRMKLQCYDENGVLIPNSFNYVTLYPSGRAVSTFGDYAAIAKAVTGRDERLMKASTWAELFTPTCYFGGTDMPKNYHGFWADYKAVPLVGHLGKTNGCSCYFLFDPATGVGTAVICNQGNEDVFSKDMLSLIYGDFDYSLYGTEPALPANVTYRNSNTTTTGGFKFLGYYGALMTPFDVSGQFWTLTPFENRTRTEFSYMDYIETPGSVLLSELFFVAIYVISLIFLAVTLIARIPISISRAVKKDKTKYALSKWSVFTSIPPFLVTILYFIVIMSTGQASSHYSWVFVVLCILMIVMLASGVYGIIMTRKSDLQKRQKVYNYLVSAAMFISAAYVCYWQMFMFWKY